MVGPGSLWFALLFLAIFDRCGGAGRAQGAAIDCSQVLAGSAGIEDGAVAQLGEHLLCKQGVSGSIPLSSTIRLVLKLADILEGKIGLHRLC